MNAQEIEEYRSVIESAKQAGEIQFTTRRKRLPYSELKAQGICTYCRQSPAENGGVLCNPCGIGCRDRQRSRYSHKPRGAQGGRNHIYQ